MGGRFSGTTTERFDQLNCVSYKQNKGFPANLRALSGMLHRLAPNLRRIGWQLEQRYDSQARAKIWTIVVPTSKK